MKAYYSKFPPGVPVSTKTVEGYSLVEMMIAITIGLFIIAALLGVVSSSARNSKTNERTSEVQTNGRYALNSMRRELREAGYRGYTWAEPNTPTTTITPLTNECLEAGATAGAFVTNIRQGIWGANDSNPFSGSCIPAANYGGDDVLVIRRLADTPTTTLVANTIYFHSSYAVGEVFRGTTAPTFTGASPLANFAVKTYVYFISPYTNSATESPQIPALYRVALQADGSMAAELVASGIEHMQVQYGRTTTDLNTRYYNASAITGTSTSTAQSDWDDVNVVRIWLLARNSTIEPGYVNTNTYAMGDQTYTVNDGFRRQLFTTVVQLRN